MLKLKKRSYFEEIIQGDRKPVNAMEKVIARTNKDAGWVLARLDIDHPAFALVHQCFKEQSKQKVKDGNWTYFNKMLLQ